MKTILGIFLALFLYCTPAQAAAPLLIQTKIGFISCAPDCDAMTFDTTPVVGHFVVLALNAIQFSDCNAISTITDSMGGGGSNTYQVDYNQDGYNNGGNVSCIGGGSTKISSVGTSFAVTAHMSGGGTTFGFIVIQEWANLATSSWFNGFTGTMNQSLTSLTVTRSSPNSTANALVIGNISLQTAGHGISDPLSGYTDFQGVDGGGWGNSWGYKTVSITETSDVSWTGLASDAFAAGVAVYKGIDSASTCKSGFLLLGTGGC